MFVLFLDIDGTLIGRADPWVQKYCNETGERTDNNEIEIPVQLLRPGLGPALQRMATCLDGQLRIYLCTKGRRGQVHACKLPTLERYFAAHGLQISRPVFCMSADGDEDMSCCPVTGKKLLRSWLARALVGQIDLEHTSRFLLVDDSVDVADDMTKVITCPTFRNPETQSNDDFWPRFAANFERTGHAC